MDIEEGIKIPRKEGYIMRTETKKYEEQGYATAEATMRAGPESVLSKGFPRNKSSERRHRPLFEEDLLSNDLCYQFHEVMMETLGQKSERGREWIITGNKRREIPDAKEEKAQNGGGEATDDTASGGKERERTGTEGMAAIKEWIKLAGDGEVEKNAEGSRSGGGQTRTDNGETKMRQ